MKIHEIDVLITYGWTRVCYNILRSLSKRGLSVAVASDSRVSMSLWSKYAKKRLIYPSFYNNPDIFIDWLEKVFLTLKPRVYIPTDEEIFIVAKYSERLRKTVVIIPISDFRTLRLLHLKSELIKTAKDLNIPVPLSIQPQSLEDVKSFAQTAGFPLVIKDSDTRGAIGVHYIYSPKELIKKYESKFSEKFSHHRPFILQEYVSGNGYGVSLLMNHGKTRAIFTHKRLRERLFRGGTSTKRISVRNEILSEYAVKILEKVNFHGVAMVEFKYNENSQRVYLLDVNPRFWGSLALPIAAGIDFPYLLYKMATEGDIKFTSEYREGIVVRWLLGDIQATVSKMTHTKNIFEPLKEFFTFDEFGFDDLYLDDCLPFLAESIYYSFKLLGDGLRVRNKPKILTIDKI